MKAWQGAISLGIIGLAAGLAIGGLGPVLTFLVAGIVFGGLFASELASFNLLLTGFATIVSSMLGLVAGGIWMAETTPHGLNILLAGLSGAFLVQTGFCREYRAKATLPTRSLPTQ